MENDSECIGLVALCVLVDTGVAFLVTLEEMELVGKQGFVLAVAFLVAHESSKKSFVYSFALKKTLCFVVNL